jgi:hypothetical protein
VDAQQCVKLTSTNRSIGLISHIACSDKQMTRTMLGPTPERRCKTAGTAGYFIYSISTDWIQGPATRSRAGASIVQVFLDDLVVIARGNTPDPIPNSAVKTLSADGTPS